jgi:hypothetical protein
VAAPWPQIGHAGEGGLYAEMIQDRSFDALAAATGFHESNATRHALDPAPDFAALAAGLRHAMDPAHSPWEPSKPTYSSKVEYNKQRTPHKYYDFR